MKIVRLKRRSEEGNNQKARKAYNRMQRLIEVLDKKEIPSKELNAINERIELVNSFEGTEKEYIKNLKKTFGELLKHIEKNLNLFPQHHFRSLWLLYGSLTGVVLTSILTNFDQVGFNSLAALILPVAVAAGIVIGIVLDNDAKKEGRQLELEVPEY